MIIVYASDAFFPRTHGVAVCIDSSIQFLAKQGHQVHVICPSYPDFIDDPSQYSSNIFFHRFQSYNLWFTSNKEERFVYRKEKSKIRQLLQNIKPDIIHIHLEFSIGGTVKKWAKENHVPTVMTIHTYYPPYFKIYIPFLPLIFWKYFVKKASQKFYRDFDVLITPSDEMKTIIKEEYQISKEVIAIPIGINLDNFDNIDRDFEYQNSFLFEKYPRIKNRKRLLFVGRIGSEKNISFLFQVMAKLVQIRQDVELILVGTGSHMSYFQEQVRKMQLEDFITFTGSFPNNEMKKIYAIADIFTFASVTETQGLVTTEAICNGIPVVALNALGSKSAVFNNHGGFLVSENVDAFLEKVLLLLNDKEIYQLKKKEVAERRKMLSFEKVTGIKLLDVYYQIIHSSDKNSVS